MTSLTTKNLLLIPLALMMVIGIIPLGFAEPHVPLNKQIQNGVPIEELTCSSNKILVEKTNGDLACVYEASAVKTGWEKVLFTKTIDDVLNELNSLEIKDSVSIKDNGEKVNSSNVSYAASNEPRGTAKGYVLLDEPLLNQVSNFESGFGADSYIKENIDELMPKITQLANKDPDRMIEMFTYDIVYSTSLNLSLTDSQDYDVFYEELDDNFSKASVKFPVTLEADYLTEDKLISGTIYPSKLGYAEIKFVSPLGTLDKKHLFLDENETIELSEYLTYTSAATNRMIDTITQQEAQQIAYSKLTDAQKEMLVFGDEVEEILDESIIFVFSDLVTEAYLENQRAATIEDLPDAPNMIAGLPKAQSFTAVIENSNSVTNGDKFDLVVKIESDNSGEYEQVYYELLLYDGLGFAKPEPKNTGMAMDIRTGKLKPIVIFNPDLFTEELRESLGDVELLFDPTVEFEGAYIYASDLEPKSIKYDRLDNFYKSFKPDVSKIESTHEIQSVQSGTWDIVVLINGEVYRSSVTVEES